MTRVGVLLLWVTVAVAQVVPDRYIVQLAGEPAATYAARQWGQASGLSVRQARGPSPLMESRRVLIRGEQQLVRRGVEAASGQVLDSLDTVANALLVRIPDSQAARLASISGVARVWPVHVCYATLDHALPLHRVPDAWAAIGGMSNAGAGVKIGILDTGIDDLHAAFQDASMTPPTGYPIVDTSAYLPMTSGKIIVARSYEYLYNGTTDSGPRDRVGHGTSVAMTAAGVTNTGPLAQITGVAPKAWLGNYRMSPGSDASYDDDAIAKALDDAVKDGMDVVNLSLGSALAASPSDDFLAQAVEAASAVGVLVVASGGNDGPDPDTVGTPAEAPSAIAVGATENDRIFAGVVTVADHAPYTAIPGDGLNSTIPIAAPLADVTTVDSTSLACNALPQNSLAGAIAVILRGVCTFEIKAINAQIAGAVAVVIRTDQARPAASGMAMGTATLPAAMISYSDGTDLVARLGANLSLQGTLDFSLRAVPAQTAGLSSFSSRGPNPGATIKPDLTATGDDMYMATQNLDSEGEMYSTNGYTVAAGTSFSCPLVTGAAAVLKSARPGLSLQQYRSLVINSATPLALADGTLLGVQAGGSGSLNLLSALRSTIAAYPTSLNLGVGSGDANVSGTVTISNLGAAPDTFTLTPIAFGTGPAPSLSAGTLQLAPGASATVTLRLALTAPAPGEYQGLLQIAGAATTVNANVPYWYGVPANTPAHLTILYSDVEWNRGGLDEQAIIFRITDPSGIALPNSAQVTTSTSGAEVVNVYSYDDMVPGSFAVNIRMSNARGDNLFDIAVPGYGTVEVIITGF